MMTSKLKRAIATRTLTNLKDLRWAKSFALTGSLLALPGCASQLMMGDGESQRMYHSMTGDPVLLPIAPVVATADLALGVPLNLLWAIGTLLTDQDTLTTIVKSAPDAYRNAQYQQPTHR